MMDAARSGCTASFQPSGRPLSVWLAGRIEHEAYQAMAERLAWEVSEPAGRPPTLVIYEPAVGISIGRLGSQTDIDLSSEELTTLGIPVRFVGRGGGVVPHGPGQIGIGLFAPLAGLGLGPTDIGGLVERFEAGLEAAVRSLRCAAVRDSRHPGIFGRSGLLATVSLAVRRGIVWHGGFLNVCPALELFRRVQTVPVAASLTRRTMGSVQAEVRRRVRLQDARTAVVRGLTDSLGCGDASIQSGVPLPPPVLPAVIQKQRTA